MATQLLLLIDYATGENWEMPQYLYEKYQTECTGKKCFDGASQTWIQYWMTTLSLEERTQISKK